MNDLKINCTKYPDYEKWQAVFRESEKNLRNHELWVLQCINETAGHKFAEDPGFQPILERARQTLSDARSLAAVFVNENVRAIREACGYQPPSFSQPSGVTEHEERERERERTVGGEAQTSPFPMRVKREAPSDIDHNHGPEFESFVSPKRRRIMASSSSVETLVESQGQVQGQIHIHERDEAVSLSEQHIPRLTSPAMVNYGAFRVAEYEDISGIVASSLAERERRRQEEIGAVPRIEKLRKRKRRASGASEISVASARSSRSASRSSSRSTVSGMGVGRLSGVEENERDRDGKASWQKRKRKKVA